MNKLLSLIYSLVLLSVSMAQPNGWKMTDRFYGFRYEVSGTPGKDFPQYVLEQADDLGCFGWVQSSRKNTFVGEVRCSKIQGPVMEERIRTRNGLIYPTEILVYPDTKIRLHFSQFKILDAGRDTCFLDKPHQCPEFSDDKDETTAFTTDEL